MVTVGLAVGSGLHLANKGRKHLKEKYPEEYDKAKENLKEAYLPGYKEKRQKDRRIEMLLERSQAVCHKDKDFFKPENYDKIKQNIESINTEKIEQVIDQDFKFQREQDYNK